MSTKMNMLPLAGLFAVAAIARAADAPALSASRLSVSGTRILMNDRPFYYQGLSFFNALYNKEFNQSAEARDKWLRTFKSYGITSLRVWGDYRLTNGWIDECPECSLYVYPEMERRDRRFEPRKPRLNTAALDRLKALASAADKQRIVIEVALFSHYNIYPVAVRTAFLKLITEQMLPYRNVFFEIWNEYSEATVEHCRTIKELDPERLVCSSPGGGGVLGDQGENSALDMLCPHTSRKPRNGNFWEVAPMEVKRLKETYNKPVIDDEPARCGTADFGGNGSTSVEQHIAQNKAVREYGGYHNYHHDMFQLPYGNTPIPPSGIPDPRFTDFHRKAFEYLRSIAPPEVTGTAQ